MSVFKRLQEDARSDAKKASGEKRAKRTGGRAGLTRGTHTMMRGVRKTKAPNVAHRDAPDSESYVRGTPSAKRQTSVSLAKSRERSGMRFDNREKATPRSIKRAVTRSAKATKASNFGKKMDDLNLAAAVYYEALDRVRPDLCEGKRWDAVKKGAKRLAHTAALTTALVGPSAYAATNVPVVRQKRQQQRTQQTIKGQQKQIQQLRTQRGQQ